MPNGKPGDHWYTDVVFHELPTFSAEIDSLIRELDGIAASGRDYTPWSDPLRQQTEQIVDGVLEDVRHDQLASRSDKVGMAYRNLTEPELAELKAKLVTLRESA